MPIISKEHQIQEQLAKIYEDIVYRHASIKTDLKDNKITINTFCHKGLQNNFISDKNTFRANQIQFIEYDIYSHIIEIINDYMDINGQFPEYRDMYNTLESIMLQLANEEKYELAGILKRWVDEIKNAIHMNGI